MQGPWLIHDRTILSPWLRRLGSFALVVLAWVAVPYAWHQTLADGLRFGISAAPKWPLAALVLWLLMVALAKMLARGAASARVQRRTVGAMVAVWLAAQTGLWFLLASPFSADALLAAGYAAGTLWLFWSWAMFFVCRSVVRRALVLSALLLLAAAWMASVRSDGVDGVGRPVIVARWTTAASRSKQETGNGSNSEIGSRKSDPDLQIPNSDFATPLSYPCFRGADGLATVANVRLNDWSAFPPRVVWRKAVGAGWGGFAVDGEQAFTQEQRGEQESVVCYRLADGEELWAHGDAAHFRSADVGDGPRATPAVSGDCVVAVGAGGLLNCLERRTGRRRWSVDILAGNEAGNLTHGISGSPLIVEGRVVVSAGGKQGKSLAAYDLATGRRAWRAGDDAAGYASPLVCRLAGRRQIVILNRPGLAAHDLDTGRLLWTFPWQNETQTNCSQPVPCGATRLFVSSGYGKGCGLLELEPRDREAWSVRAVWTSRSMKTKFTSAVVRDGFAYGLDEGILCCVDLADGRRRWRAGRYGHGQVLSAGDKLLVQAESGDVVLVAAEPDAHRELGRCAALNEKTWNHPALAGRWLLCRNDRQAVCLELGIADCGLRIGSGESTISNPQSEIRNPQ